MSDFVEGERQTNRQRQRERDFIIDSIVYVVIQLRTGSGLPHPLIVVPLLSRNVFNKYFGDEILKVSRDKNVGIYPQFILKQL